MDRPGDAQEMGGRLCKLQDGRRRAGGDDDIAEDKGPEEKAARYRVRAARALRAALSIIVFKIEAHLL